VTLNWGHSSRGQMEPVLRRATHNFKSAPGEIIHFISVKLSPTPPGLKIGTAALPACARSATDALLTHAMFTFDRVWSAGPSPNGSGVGDVPPNPAPLLPRTLWLQNRMRTVIMKLPPKADFLAEMAGMREWLDKHRCAASMFKYHLEQESVIIEVEFKEEEEAEIFKQYFDRAKTIWISVGVLGSEL
jgi:hypothetical protein